MDEIEKGTWIIAKNGHIIKYDPYYCKKDFIKEIWTPKENEICWFWNHNDKYRLLAKFRSFNNELYYIQELLTFDNCEPFTNKLPTGFEV